MTIEYALDSPDQHEDEPGKGSFRIKIVKGDMCLFDNRVPHLDPLDTQSYLRDRIKIGDLATAIRPDESDTCLLLLNPHLNHLRIHRLIFRNGSWQRKRRPENSHDISFTPMNLETYERVAIKGVVIENNERKPVNIELTFIPGTQT